MMMPHPNMNMNAPMMGPPMGLGGAQMGPNFNYSAAERSQRSVFGKHSNFGVLIVGWSSRILYGAAAFLPPETITKVECLKAD